MIDYPVFIGLWVVVLIFIVANRSKRFNNAKHVLNDQGDWVYCRDLPMSRLFKMRGKAVKKSEVIKVQKAHRCVSLVMQSGKTLDILLPKVTIDEVGLYARSLFPEASYVESDKKKL